MASSPADSSSDLELGGRLSRRLFGLDPGEPGAEAATAVAPPFRVPVDEARGAGTPPAAPAQAQAAFVAPVAAAPVPSRPQAVATGPFAGASAPAPAGPTGDPTAGAESPLPDLHGDWQALATWCLAALGAESVVLVDRRGLLLASAGVGAGRQLQGTGARLLFLLEQCDAFGRGPSKSVDIELAGVRLFSTRVTTADGIPLTLAVSSRSELPARARARAAHAVAVFRRE